MENGSKIRNPYIPYVYTSHFLVVMMRCIVGPVAPAMSLSAWSEYVDPSSANAFSRVIGCPSQYIIVLASPGDEIVFPESV